MGRARAVGQEVGQDRAEAGVIRVAELAVVQQLHRMGRIGAGLDPTNPDMRATHVGGQERRRRGGRGMGRNSVGGYGHTDSIGWAWPGLTRRLRRSL
ncbi:hypothetical protein D3C71_1510820 [compost metagenome]